MALAAQDAFHQFVGQIASAQVDVVGCDSRELKAFFFVWYRVARPAFKYVCYQLTIPGITLVKMTTAINAVARLSRVAMGLICRTPDRLLGSCARAR